MTGHKKELRPGVWRLRVSAGKDPATGKYRYVQKVVYGGPRVASQELVQLVASSRGGPSSGATVEDLFQEFFELCERSGLAKTTVFSYKVLTEKHILPALGNSQIVSVSARDLDKLYAQMSKKGLSAARVRYAHAIIRRALNQAVKWGWISVNVAKLATPPSVKRTVLTAPSPEELDQILAATLPRSVQMTAFFALLALTGMRRGEGLALRWSDYDEMSKVLTISRSLAYTPELGIFEKPTKKYNSDRRIGVDQLLESVIASQMEALRKNVELGFELVSDPFLFPGSPDGSIPLHPDTPSKLFRKICDTLGFPYHLHQLRHFVGTQLVAAGFDSSTIAGLLGHDPVVLERTYVHRVEARDRAALAHLESLIRLPDSLTSGNSEEPDEPPHSE